MVPYFSCFPGLPTEPPAPWEADAITILELLDWPSVGCCLCLKLPVGVAYVIIPESSWLSERHRSLHCIRTSSLLSATSFSSISGNTVIFTHIHKHILKYRNSTADKFTYSFKEGRRNVAIQDSLSALFCLCQMGASLKELC